MHVNVSHPCASLRGELTIPGDKSISHRALLLAAIATGRSQLNNCLLGEDNLALIAALRLLGVMIHINSLTVDVVGQGLLGLKSTTKPLDLKNSGTAIRLLTGLLAGQTVTATLMGDHSLMQRPMRRISEPLIQMGAAIQLSEQSTAPIILTTKNKLQAIQYELPVASAQVKSTILLAALGAQGKTVVIEKIPTRDHTERLLPLFGVGIQQIDRAIILQGQQTLQAAHINIPGDISSAAFFIVAATLIPGSEILLKNVGINSTRIGIIQLLKKMGANIALSDLSFVGQEPVANLLIKSASLKAIEITADDIPAAIDELPILFIAAACAAGITTVRGAQELRVKESDRLLAMHTGLQRLGIKTELLPDGIVIEGGPMLGGVVDSYGDHRIAMAFLIAGACAPAPITVQNCEWISTSFPTFFECAKKLGCKILQNG